MVTAALPLAVVSELDFRVEIVKDGRTSLPGQSSRTLNSRALTLECLGRVATEEAILQLFHMTLASLRGYQELSQLVRDEPLKTFLDVVIRQRTARCHSLAGLLPRAIRLPWDFNPDEESLADPSAFELRIVWLRAIWSFEKGEFGRFGDHVEMAEVMLEDACLTAAHTFRTSDPAVFLAPALEVCGVRQRLEELAGDLAIAARKSTDLS